MSKPTVLDWHLYGGGLLVAVGTSAIYAPAGLIVLGAWFCYLGRFYVLQRGRGKDS